MESMTLKCPVTVKAKVTEELKKHMAESIQSNLQKVELELQQIELQARRILAEQAESDLQGVAAGRQQIEMEKHKRLDFKNQMLAKAQETERLEIGSEIVQGTLERVVEVKVGDKMPELMNAEILVEDGNIIAFRN